MMYAVCMLAGILTGLVLAWVGRLISFIVHSRFRQEASLTDRGKMQDPAPPIGALVEGIKPTVKKIGNGWDERIRREMEELEKKR